MYMPFHNEDTSLRFHSGPLNILYTQRISHLHVGWTEIDDILEYFRMMTLE